MGLHGCTLFLLIGISYISRYSCQWRYVYVTKCPRIARSRKMHSDMLNCTWNSPVNVYHCLPTIKGSFVEFCFVDTPLWSKSGCPYFTEVNGSKQIKQKACKSNKYGCPEAIKDETFLSSEVYIFPNCLSIPVKSTTTKESSTNISTIFKFVEVNDSRTRQTRFDSVTPNGSTADMEKLLLMNPIFFLGVGLFVLICGFTGYVAFQLYKRIKNLRERMETENCMSVELYNVATTQRYEESENEPLYDCVHDDEETSRPYSESVSNVEANSCCYCQTKQV